jgi:hypothetical protein
MFSVRWTVAVCGVGVVESVTLNVSEVLGAVGVPLITPVEAFRVNGLGSGKSRGYILRSIA